VEEEKRGCGGGGEGGGGEGEREERAEEEAGSHFLGMQVEERGEGDLIALVAKVQWMLEEWFFFFGENGRRW
jgi:hypothetical protein